MHQWMDGWVDGWTDRLVDGCVVKQIHSNILIVEPDQWV